jgi:DNA-binding NtrC family response regulator
MKKPPGTETAATRSATVLSVGTDPVDGVTLERIFHASGWRAYTNTEWTLITRATLTSAFSVLREMPVPIVLCDCDLMLGTWRDMLEYISALPDPPLLIVTSEPADERLWAEAPNLGAYDVLAKPFDATEVIRILSLAWQHWQDRYGVYRSRTKQRTAAAGKAESTVEERLYGSNCVNR